MFDNKKPFIFAVIALFLLSGCMSGCGYTTASLLPPGLDSIYVSNFANEIEPTREISDRRNSYSYRPGLENEITRAVIDGFIFDRHLDIVSEKEAALVLKGSLVDFRQYPLSYSDGLDVEEFRMEIYVSLELYNKKTGELMWQDSSFMGLTNYTVTGPNKKTGAQAQKAAVEDLAQRIVERIVEHW